MVKAKFVVDNREAGETEDCGLIVAIGLGEMKEENQFQLAVVGGKRVKGFYDGPRLSRWHSRSNQPHD